MDAKEERGAVQPRYMSFTVMDSWSCSTRRASRVSNGESDYQLGRL
jgi:hypothetical protein